MGELQFGVLGGHINGSVKPEIRLEYVVVRQLRNELAGFTGGRCVSLLPFDRKHHRPGYLGVWRKVDLPPYPENLPAELYGAMVRLP